MIKFRVFALTAALCLAFLLVGSPANGGEGSTTPASASQHSTALSFAARVAYQSALEEVYWRHRIWPSDNPTPKPPLQELISPAQLEEKVRSYLRESQRLEQKWQRVIMPEELQEEMERMARDSRQTAVLREIFAALGNDPGSHRGVSGAPDFGGGATRCQPRGSFRA